MAGRTDTAGFGTLAEHIPILPERPRATAQEGHDGVQGVRAETI